MAAAAALPPSKSCWPENMAAEGDGRNLAGKIKWGLTWHHAPLWQFNRKAVLDGASDELHSLPVCLSLCKCHRQSGNARLLCFSGCLMSCSRTKGGISINTVPMSITHVTWQHKQGKSRCRHMLLNTWRRIEPRLRLYYCTQLQCVYSYVELQSTYSLACFLWKYIWDGLEGS